MRKNVKFEYYRPNLVNIQNQEMQRIELDTMLNHLYHLKVNGEVIRYEFNNEIAKLEHLFWHEDIRCWQICFERLRDFNLPVKSSFERESEPIDLEENEFIGEEVSLLYDVHNRVLMIQRNKNSLSPSALEMFLGDLYRRLNERELNQYNFEINPILHQNALQEVLDSSQIRKLIVRVDDLGHEINMEDDLSFLTHRVTQYEASSLDVTLSVGRERDREMGEGAIKRLIRNISERQNVSKAQVYARFDDESNVEKYDLIEQKLFNIGSFDFRENRNLRPDAVFDKMRDIYFGEDGDGVVNRIPR
ncbi:DUF6731 family protein [Virgibacillus ainsalahensis]